MKFNLKLISLILILFFISVSAVCAEDAVQTDDNNETLLATDNIDETETTGIYSVDETESTLATAQPKEFYELQQEIWRTPAGSTIELDSDYINLGKRPNGDGITIDRTITIDGKGHTLDGNNQDIFYIQQGKTNVIFKNIVFINGKKNCGGAIFADDGTDYLTVENCTFKNNKAAIAGGAIQANGNYVKITNNRFENNLAPSSGGAIRIEGNSATISNNIFTGNKATDALGGAICALGHNIKITDNKFTKNVAGRDGGAICIEGTKLEDMGTKNVISKNVFDSNKVSGSSEGSHGGAISMAGENCEISYNNFTNNHADTIGGAIRWNGANSAMGSLIGNRFESNDAKSGGAIYISGNKLQISKNKFNNNKATSGAGGSINIHGDSAIISDNEITNSKTNAIGGGIYVEGKNTQIKNNNLTKCSAGDNGGGAYLTGSGSVVDSSFTSCSATDMGGGIYFKTTDYSLRGNSFSLNNADKGANYYPTSMPSGKIVTNLKATDVTGYYGENKYIIATLTDNNGNPIQGAKIAFSNNGMTYISTDASGKARYRTNELAPGSYSVKVTFFGDNTYEASNTPTVKVTISKIATKLSVTNLQAPYKSQKYIIATLKDNNGNPIQGAKIAFSSINGIKYVETDSTGKARFFTDKLEEGTHDIKVVYFGNNTYEKSTATSKVVISKLATKLTVTNIQAPYKSQKYIIATLKDNNGNPIQGAKIAFASSNGIKYVETDNSGKARFFTDKLEEGTHNIKTVFFGDDTYEKSTATSKVVITKVATKLTVTNLKAPYKSQKYIIAILKDNNGNPISDASICFAYNGLKYINTDSNGKARFFVDNLEKGTHKITVVFFGNDVYSASEKLTSTVTIT